MVRRKKTSDALAIIDRRFFRTRKARRELATAEAHNHVSQLIFDLRTRAGLTQHELARRVGTSHSVISRIEGGDYQGHSLALLRRVAAALGKRVEIRFVDEKRARGA
jgi:DNA-binding XRE family transcriptional regulator